MGNLDPCDTGLYLLNMSSHHILRRSNCNWKSRLDTSQALPYGQTKIA
jgi:hypothetical protein